MEETEDRSSSASSSTDSNYNGTGDDDGAHNKTANKKKDGVEEEEAFVPPLSCLLEDKEEKRAASTRGRGRGSGRGRGRGRGNERGIESGRGSTVGHQEKRPRKVEEEESSDRSDKVSGATKDGRPAKKQKVFQYGNYDRYYGYRNKDRRQDPRLEVFHSEWLAGKRCLDIGCNVGSVTMAIARRFGCSFIRGIDLDGSLINRAKNNLAVAQRNATSRSTFQQKEAKKGTEEEKEKAEQKEDETKEKDNVKEHTDRKGKQKETNITTETNKKETSFPFNIEFRAENILDDNIHHDQPYDVIFCLSLTKWIHLNWGDEGIKRFFRKVYNLLNEGGKVVLEPQEWSTYRKKAKLTAVTKKHYQEIRFKPDQFQEYLLSDEVGFKSCEDLQQRLDVAKTKQGFKRPIFLLTK
ncbi:RNA methyltransferase [Balamuthia mandrillaris]